MCIFSSFEVFPGLILLVSNLPSGIKHAHDEACFKHKSTSVSSVAVQLGPYNTTIASIRVSLRPYAPIKDFMNPFENIGQQYAL